jgi:hypothetical protein
MISPKDMIDRIQESYAEGRDRERAAVLKAIDTLLKFAKPAEQGVLLGLALLIREGRHVP